MCLLNTHTQARAYRRSRIYSLNEERRFCTWNLKWIVAKLERFFFPISKQAVGSNVNWLLLSKNMKKLFFTIDMGQRLNGVAGAMVMSECQRTYFYTWMNMEKSERNIFSILSLARTFQGKWKITSGLLLSKRITIAWMHCIYSLLENEGKHFNFVVDPFSRWNLTIFEQIFRWTLDGNIFHFLIGASWLTLAIVTDLIFDLVLVYVVWCRVHNRNVLYTLVFILISNDMEATTSGCLKGIVAKHSSPLRRAYSNELEKRASLQCFHFRSDFTFDPEYFTVAQFDQMTR